MQIVEECNLQFKLRSIMNLIADDHIILLCFDFKVRLALQQIVGICINKVHLELDNRFPK